MNILKAAATCFDLVFGAGFLFGAVRVPLLVLAASVLSLLMIRSALTASR